MICIISIPLLSRIRTKDILQDIVALRDVTKFQDSNIVGFDVTSVGFLQ